MAAQTLKIPVRGLHTAPNARTAAPPGALVIADDVEVRNGEASKRRGMQQAIARGATTLWPFQDRLLVHKDSALGYTDTGVTAITDYSGPFNGYANRKLRAASQNGNAYLATTAGVKRLDSVTGYPVSAGVPMGLDVQGELSGVSGFLANDSAVAYRVVWGTRDANGNLILGAPSGRTVVANTSGGSRDVAVSTSIPDGITSSHFWQLYRTQPSVGAAVDPGDEMGLVFEGPAPDSAAVTQLVRATNVVTASAVAHGFKVGQTVRVGPSVIGSGVAVAVGFGGAVSTSPDGLNWTARVIPAGWYRAAASSGAMVVAVGQNVAASSPDGITWTARAIPAGDYRSVVWTGARFVALGASGVCATSPDGITWTAQPVAAARGYTGAWNGATIVVAGGAFIYTSPDGIAWTNRGAVLPSGMLLQSIVWTGSQFIGASEAFPAVADAITTSPDGITWTRRTTPAATLQSVTQGNGLAVAVGLSGACLSSPDGVTWTSRALPAGTYRSVVWNGTRFIALGDGAAAATSADGVTWAASADPAGDYYGITFAGNPFNAGDRTIVSVPTADSFTYADAGTDGSYTGSLIAAPLTATVSDQIPSTFAGATLYTSQSQEGILASAYEPPAAVDIAEFRGTMFWLNTTDRATLDMYVLAAGAPSGLQNGDTVTINGMVFTGAGAEDVPTRAFKVTTGGTPAANVAATAASLVRVVNRAQGSPVYLRDLSGVNDAPGHLQLAARVRTDSIALTVSRASAWALTDGTTAAPEVKPHELRWSANGKPDAAPILNVKALGDKNKEGLRVVALRDYLFVLKRDGVWRLSGDGINWSVTPLDTTLEIVAPESVAVLDNTIFALSNKGVVQITDTGVTIISDPIRDQIDRLLAEPLLSTVRLVAHGVAYESEGRYTLWVPTATTDTLGTMGWVFDQFSSLASGQPVWTVRTDDASAAIVNPKDGKLYRATASAIFRERKELSFRDYSDGESQATIDTIAGEVVTLSAGTANVGDALEQGAFIGIVTQTNGPLTLTLDRYWEGAVGPVTVHAAIPSVIEFAPAVPTQGAANHWAEAVFLFRSLAGGRMTAEFATELTRGWSLGVYEFPIELGLELSAGFSSVNFYGTRDYGLVEGISFPVNLRTWIPMDCQRSERLAVRFVHSQAFSQMQMEGLSLIYRPVSSRVRR